MQTRLEMDVFPVLGHKPIADITAPQLLAMAKKVESRGALDIARRAWQTCGQVFEYALAHGMVERNPSKDVRPGSALIARKKEHYARIDAKELPELLRKIEAYVGSPYCQGSPNFPQPWSFKFPHPVEMRCRRVSGPTRP